MDALATAVLARRNAVHAYRVWTSGNPERGVDWMQEEGRLRAAISHAAKAVVDAAEAVVDMAALDKEE